MLGKWLELFDHPIGLIELYAIAVAYNLWGDKMTGKRVIAFCDNWTAIDVFVKGSSRIKTWRDLLLVIETLDEKYGAWIWMARVPSTSNISDPPSRGSLKEVDFLQATFESSVQCPVVKRMLKNITFG